MDPVGATAPPQTIGRPSLPRPEKHVLHWFRKGLRLHDNPALLKVLTGATTIRFVYTLDPWYANAKHETNKWRFLLECLEDLDQALKKCGSRLFVLPGQAPKYIPACIEKWNITHLSFERDSEPFSRNKDASIVAAVQDLGVEVIQDVAHTLYDIDSIMEANNNRPPFTYKRFQRLLQRMDPPPTPVPAISAENFRGVRSPATAEEISSFAIPTLQSLGFEMKEVSGSSVWPGGETVALERLARHLERKAWVASVDEPRMNAKSLMANQCVLTPYLRFGCLSARLFYWELCRLYVKLKKGNPPPMSLFGQLYWREFFYTVASNNLKFDRIDGNPICLQIPWNQDKVALAKWAEAKTGFPWIDAIMTQLKTEGWIHALARHAVGCFLTRGDLWLSWEEGMKVFHQLLLDVDWSLNAGMWMWLSSSSFFHQFHYVNDPVNFGKQIDPEGTFIRKYLPVLKDFPAEYIYEPWKAPLEVQEKLNCKIGQHYPKPMVNHERAKRINSGKMRNVYVQLLKDSKLARNSQDRAAIEQMVIHSIESTETTESRQPLPAASPLPNSDRDVTVQQQSAGATASMSSLALQPSLQLPPPQSQ